jgi:hypothetical protein
MTSNAAALRFSSIKELSDNTHVESFASVKTQRLVPAVLSLFDQAETYCLSKHWEDAYFLYIKGVM